jgi:sortase (surface protein transpeptidase)
VAVPDRLDLPTLGIRTAIRPVGVDATGDLQIPADVAEVGWYRFGPRPGDPSGSTVLSGHVDSAEQGRGAFFRLRELTPGDPVVVHSADGRTRRYRVVAREEWPKSEVPLERIFGRGGAARLTLVTCGGGFREDVRSYTDNIAVTAVPDGAP